MGRAVSPLSSLCQELVLAYTHQVVTRQLDPCSNQPPPALSCSLPPQRAEEERCGVLLSAECYLVTTALRVQGPGQVPRQPPRGAGPLLLQPGAARARGARREMRQVPNTIP